MGTDGDLRRRYLVVALVNGFGIVLLLVSLTVDGDLLFYVAVGWIILIGTASAVSAVRATRRTRD